MAFRYGHLQIPQEDFKLIAKAMGANPQLDDVACEKDESKKNPPKRKPLDQEHKNEEVVKKNRVVSSVLQYGLLANSQAVSCSQAAAPEVAKLKK